jgi:ABC-2 type transport system permease protein
VQSFVRDDTNLVFFTERQVMFRTILALIKKEFYQVRRDKNMLRMIFLMPLVQLFLLGYVAGTDVKLIYTAIYDYDRSDLSREYIRSFSPGDYFIINATNIPLLEADKGFRENRYNAVMVIPKDFSESLQKGKTAQIGFIADGTNAYSASIAIGYANLITEQFNQKVTGLSLPIFLVEKRLYNPEGESVYFMVPGIIALLLTMITVVLTAMAIVREREIGTLEQLMVTPLTTPALILGKIIPFAIIGFVEFSLALFVGIIWFKIPFVGSWVLLYALAFIYLFTTLGIGMFISTITHTQQQAMFFTWFFTIFAILTSGFFTPIANMPQSVQYLTYLNPLRYFIEIVRGIIMKGASFDVLYPEAIAMVIFGVVIFSLSWMRFSKRVK